METKQLNREKIWGEFRTLLRETATKLSITVSEDTLSVFEVTRSAPTERKVLLNFKAPYDHCFVHIEEGQSKTVRQFSFHRTAILNGKVRSLRCRKKTRPKKS